MINKDVEDLKRSYNDITHVVDQQRKANRHNEIEKAINEIMNELDKSKVAHEMRDVKIRKVEIKIERASEHSELISQKKDNIHKQCEENEKQLKKLRSEFAHYIETEAEKKR